MEVKKANEVSSLGDQRVSEVDGDGQNDKADVIGAIGEVGPVNWINEINNVERGLPQVYEVYEVYEYHGTLNVPWYHFPFRNKTFKLHAILNTFSLR